MVASGAASSGVLSAIGARAVTEVSSLALIVSNDAVTAKVVGALAGVVGAIAALLISRARGKE